MTKFLRKIKRYIKGFFLDSLMKLFIIKLMFSHILILCSLCEIHPEVEGSDHCPVSARFNLILDPSSKPPSSATKYYPEFQVRLITRIFYLNYQYDT